MGKKGRQRPIRICKSETYKYVTKMLSHGKDIVYVAGLLNKSKQFENEREAAIYVDKVLILAGKKPVNILKKI